MTILLSVQSITKRFGGLQALSRVTFDLPEGQILGLIGPNGAGKSTFFDLITGRAKPDKGKIEFGSSTAQSNDLTRLNEFEINRLGIGRKLQTPSVYARHTVGDNRVLSLQGPRGVFASLCRPLSSEERDPIADLLKLRIFRVGRTILKRSAKRTGIAQPG